MSTTPLFPVAISSQLDNTGVERIHAAKLDTIIRPVFIMNCPIADSYDEWGASGNNSTFYVYYDPDAYPSSDGMQGAPQWLIDAANNGDGFLVDFFNTGTYTTYETGDAITSNRVDGEEIDHDAERPVTRGTIYSMDMSQSICFDWFIPAGV